MKRTLAIFSVVILLLVSYACIGFSQDTDHRRPSPKQITSEKQSTTRAAKVRTMKLLSKLTDDDRAVVLSGQNLGHSNADPVDAYLKNIERLGRHTGHFPALLGADYGYDEIPDDFSETNHLLRRHYESRGLVTISMHPPNPWKQSESHDLRIGDLRELTDPNSRVHLRWRYTLDQIADGLSELQQLGVVVLWRPLHEMNGGWFWWGAHKKDGWVSQEEYVAVWKDMHDYFTNTHGLDNLLWVYSAAVQKGDGEKPADYYYPGDEYVDIVGLDWYDDKLEGLDDWQSYSQLAAMGKPMGLTEFGPLERRNGSFNNQSLMRVIADDYPKLGFFMFWHSWPGADVAIVDNTDSRAIMRDPRVITIER